MVLVGHNPAMEELIHLATGRFLPMPTSALAVLELDSWSQVAEGTAGVVAAGRPADDQWSVE